MEKKIDYNTEARKKASRKYDQKQEKIILRFPIGFRSTVNKYIQENKEEHPEWFFKGEPSLNAFIRSLVSKEIGKNIGTQEIDTD